ncbi:MAG: YdcF family protein [Bryobacteraceae bacterium]
MVFRKLMRVLVVLLAGLGLLMVVVTFTPLVSWYARLLAGAWNDPRGEVLIVLAAEKIDSSRLGLGSYWRSVYAELAWREGGFRQVVVAGAGIAPLMRDFLVCHGVPAGSMVIEDASSSTREQALNVQRLLAGTPGVKVLLTSDYHMFRARRAFLKAGLEVRPRPFPDALKQCSHFSGRWSAFLAVAAETGKIVYYFCRGWI